MEKGIFLLQTMFMILFVFFSIGCDDNTTNIAKVVTLKPDELNPIRTIDSRLQRLLAEHFGKNIHQNKSVEKKK